jgi:hypothetical protein
MGRALPTLSYVDAYWRDQTGELMVFSTSKKSRALFEGLFRSTFADHLGCQLLAMEPLLMGMTAADLADSQVASEAVSRLSLATPVIFTEPSPQ